MNKSAYTALLFLIIASTVSIIGMQYYWLKNQYQQEKESLTSKGNEVLKNLDSHLRKELNSRADIDTDDIEDLDFYYQNPDSTITFLIESINKKRNADGTIHEMDEQVLKDRLVQFEEIVGLLENKRSADQPNLAESFIVLYGQDDLEVSDEKIWPAMVGDFKVDSLIRTNLTKKKIKATFQYGVYNHKVSKWMYLTEDADSLKLSASDINHYLLNESESIFLNLEEQGQILLKNMGINLLLSALLILAILGSLVYMLSVIRRLKEVSEIKNDFINNMTHEFKTPLATIAFATANIENPVFQNNHEKILEFTKVIKEENARMNRQIGQVLDAAVSEKRAYNLTLEEVDIHHLISDVAENITMKFPSTKHRLSLNLDGENPVISGDRLHLRNVISNLLDNAFKYSPAGGTIRISTESREMGLTIVIKDEGMGMKKETVKKIFEKFYRVPSGNLHNIKGFGLGLSYAKAIVEQHDGSIEVSSELNKGSTFIIFLPSKKR